jgi:hypothetical protein
MIPDEERPKHEEYIEDLKKDNFKNLHRLEESLIKRLALENLETDPNTQVYIRSLMNSAAQAFVVLHTLKKKSDFHEEEKQKLEKAKGTILRLAEKLLKHTYFLDKTPYLLRSETAFFFHTHPYHETWNYPKEPSTQDKLSSFRAGPSLVFDIQKDYIEVYSVILGRVKKIKQYAR